MLKNLKEISAELLSQGCFKQDASGRDVWYPYGCKGYIVADREKYQNLEKRLNIALAYASVFLPILALENLALGAWAALTVAIWYFLVKRDALSGLERSGEQLSHIEAIKENIRATSIELHGFTCVSSLTFAGCFIYLGNTFDAFLFLSLALVLAYKTVLKWKDLKATNSLPAYGKSYLKEGATVLLVSVLFSLSFFAWGFLAGWLIAYSKQY